MTGNNAPLASASHSQLVMAYDAALPRDICYAKSHHLLHYVTVLLLVGITKLFEDH